MKDRVPTDNFTAAARLVAESLRQVAAICRRSVVLALEAPNPPQTCQIARGTAPTARCTWS